MTVNEWLPHDGGPNPVREGETLTELRFRNGKERKDDGRNWHWGAVGGTFDITHYRVSPPRKAEPAPMSADEVLIRAREAAIEAIEWRGTFAAETRKGNDDNMNTIRAILAYERDRAKPLAEVAPHTVEDADEKAAYDVCMEKGGLFTRLPTANHRRPTTTSARPSNAGVNWSMTMDEMEKLAQWHEGQASQKDCTGWLYDHHTAAAATIRAVMAEIERLRGTLRREARACEMSASLMRNPERTGGWMGAEGTARAFDRIGAFLRAALKAPAHD